MELNDFLDYVNSGNRITAPSEELAYCSYLSQEALKITAQINSGYHGPNELRQLFAQLCGQPVNETLRLIPPFYTDCGKNIHLGENVFLNAGCTFQDQGGITIGDRVLIGNHGTIVTLNHDFDPDKRQDLHPSPVFIGNDVWLGSNVTILPGVTIGDGAIIAAGAVENRNIPARTIAAGVPAKVIKEI